MESYNTWIRNCQTRVNWSRNASYWYRAFSDEHFEWLMEQNPLHERGRHGDITFRYEEHPEGVATSPCFDPELGMWALLSWMGGPEALGDWVMESSLPELFPITDSPMYAWVPALKGFVAVAFEVTCQARPEDVARETDFTVQIHAQIISDSGRVRSRSGWPECVPYELAMVNYVGGRYVPMLTLERTGEVVEANYSDVRDALADDLGLVSDMAYENLEGLVARLAVQRGLPRPPPLARTFRDPAWARRAPAVAAWAARQMKR